MYAINPELCTFCKKCMEECPSGAITEGSVDGKEVCVVNAVARLRRCEALRDRARQSAKGVIFIPTERKGERTGGRFGTLFFYREKVETMFFSTESHESGAFGGGEGGFGCDFLRLCYNLYKYTRMFRWKRRSPFQRVFVGERSAMKIVVLAAG